MRQPDPICLNGQASHAFDAWRALVNDCLGVLDRAALRELLTRTAAVHAEVDPHRGAVNGVALDAGLRAKVADAAMPDPMTPGPPEQYPPNPVASAMLTTLGHAPARWFGVIAIVGTENDDGDHHLAHRRPSGPRRLAS